MNAKENKREWANAAAASFVRKAGSLVVDANAKPSAKSRNRIDIVAYDVAADCIAFCAVRTADDMRRLCGVSRTARLALRRAGRAWARANGWRGAVRHDVIGVYGAPGELPVIDHVRNVEVCK